MNMLSRKELDGAKAASQGSFPNHSSSSCSDFLLLHRLENVPEDLPGPAESPRTIAPYLLQM
jgi:hypothetical protein